MQRDPDAVALRREVEAGRFREDLMYRIRVIPLFLPRLAEREGDIELLAQHFVTEFAPRCTRAIRGFDAGARNLLLNYDWPGNVRELRNVVEHAIVMGESAWLGPQDLPPELRGEAPRAERPRDTSEFSERDRVLAALTRAGGRKGEAAAALGWSRSTLWRKMREMKLRAGQRE